MSSRKSKRQPELVENDEQDFQRPENRRLTEDELNYPGEWEGQWKVECKKQQLDFCASTSAVPKQARGECLVYLYRLWPEVQNANGNPKYIRKYTLPLDIDTIKTNHGGGQFFGMLKRGSRTLREDSNIFTDGDPLYEKGQTRKDGAPTTIEASLPPKSELAEVVKEVASALNTKGNDAAMEVMQGAMTRSLQIQASALEKSANSTTGSAIGDKILEASLAKMMNPPAAPTLIETLALVKEILALQPKPERNPAQHIEPTDPVDELNKSMGVIKTLTGVESIADLIKNNGAPDPTPWWATPATNLISQLPNLFQQFRQAQAEAFERALYLRQLPPAPTAAAAGTPPTRPNFATEAPAAPAMPGAPAVPPSQAQLAEMWPRVVGSICHAFDEGADGYSTVTHLQLSYGAPMVEMFFPTLAQVEQVRQIVAGLPDLASRAQSSKWPQFQEDFITAVQEVLDDQTEGEEEAPAAGPTTAPAPNGKAAATVAQAS